MAYRLLFGSYELPESLTYNLITFRSAVPNTKLPRVQGARVPRGYLGERRIEIRGLIKTSSGSSLQSQIDGLRSAFAQGPAILYLPNDRHFREVQKDDNGQERFENTWPERLSDISIDLITGDPFMYSDTESEDLANAVSATDTDITINNADGNAPALPTITVTASGGEMGADIPATSIKGATEFQYTSGSYDYHYGCLNGDVMTAYIDAYGGLGLQPFHNSLFTFVSKTAGSADPVTGFPADANIGTDGQLEPTSGPYGFGILRSLDSRNGEASTEAAILERKELLTVGQGTVAAGWSVKGDSADLQGGIGDDYLRGIDGTLIDFSVAGANAGGALSAETTVMYYDFVTGDGSGEVLEVKVTWSFQNAETALEKTRLTCTVELTNKTGSTLNNVKFAFGIDPNPNITTGSEFKQFFMESDPNAFGAKGGGGDHIGIGVYHGDANADGTLIGIVNATTESSLCYFADSLLAATRYIKLGSGTNAEYYEGGVLDSSTSNFQTDNTWRNNLHSGTSAIDALLLRSPEFDIAASATETFTFYLFTRTSGGGDVTLDATLTNETTGEAFSLQGEVEDGTEIVVNSLEETVTVEGEDRMDLFDGLFPRLNPGNNTLNVAYASGEITNVDVTWNSRWY